MKSSTSLDQSFANPSCRNFDLLHLDIHLQNHGRVISEISREKPRSVIWGSRSKTWRFGVPFLEVDSPSRAGDLASKKPHELHLIWHLIYNGMLEKPLSRMNFTMIQIPWFQTWTGGLSWTKDSWKLLIFDFQCLPRLAFLKTSVGHYIHVSDPQMAVQIGRSPHHHTPYYAPDRSTFRTWVTLQCAARGLSRITLFPSNQPSFMLPSKRKYELETFDLLIKSY